MKGTLDQTIAILGAGPIGLEAALYAALRGYDVQVYEREEPGAHVRRWGHVEFFSPWSMNRSEWGEAALRGAGVELARGDICPDGEAYVEEYLGAIAAHPALAGRVHGQTEVVGVSRVHALKGDFIGDAERGARPFLIALRDATGPRWARADVVIDTTGVYQQPNALGPGGLPALGEAEAAERIERWIPDVLGAERGRYAGRRTLLVGAGYSAVTSARLLASLREEAPGTEVVWLTRGPGPSYTPLEDDPLPQRRELAEFGARAAAGGVDGFTAAHGYLWSIEPTASGLRAEIGHAGETSVARVDRIIANTGYKPDAELYRELQIHQCYASEGPMRLAAYLLSQAGGGGDCLAQTAGGVETLTNPEPNFFVLGAKSYGRNSDFLLKLGYEQIEAVFEHLRG